MIEMPSSKFNPLIELCFVDETTIFVCGAEGNITIGMLEEIENDVLENGLDMFERGVGTYLFRASYYKGQYGEYGACELAPGWELDFVAFEPFEEDEDEQTR